MSSFVGDKLGRRGGLFIIGLLGTVGSILETVATNFGTLLAGKIIVGMVSSSIFLSDIRA